MHFFPDPKRQSSYSGFENNNKYEPISNSNGSRRIDGGETISRKHVSDNQMASILDRRHLEDVTNHQQQQQQSVNNMSASENRGNNSKALLIDDPLNRLDPVRIAVSII